MSHIAAEIDVEVAYTCTAKTRQRVEDLIDESDRACPDP